MILKETVARSAKTLVLVAICLSFFGCAAEKAYKRGRKATALGQWDDAVRHFAEAVSRKPKPEYRSALTLSKVKASQFHLEIGKRLRDSGRLELAMVEYKEALDLDPTNRYVGNELERLYAEIKEQKETEDAQLSDIEKLKEASPTPSTPFMLNPKSAEPITLTFTKTNVKEIYTALGKAAGINILYEDGVRDSDFSIDISNISFRRALDQIAMANRHFYKVLDESTIFLIPDNPTKRREYEDNIIKTFYLSNATINDVLAMLRQILDVRKVGQNPALNSITIKDTPDKIAVAERIINANDKPPAEVIIDVEILEVFRQKKFQYGIDLSTYTITQTLDLGDVSGGEGADALTGLRLSQLDDINRDNWLFTVPSLSYTLFKSGGFTRSLAKPSLRALDGKQVSLRLGDQVPIETSTFSGTGAQFATRNFQFRDIGINIDITPRVHHNNEVTLLLKFEITSVGADPDGPGGPIPPTFGNRTVNTEIRLKDGESNLLAGLYTERDAMTRSGLPGLVNLPILKHIFASNDKSYQETDIVLTLTPHIVRTPNITKADLEPFWVGSEQNIKFSNVGLVSPSGKSPFDTSEEESNEAAPSEASPETTPAQERMERLRRLREQREQGGSSESTDDSGSEPLGMAAPESLIPGSADEPAQRQATALSTGAAEPVGSTKDLSGGEGSSAAPLGAPTHARIPAVVSFSPSFLQAGTGEVVDLDIVISSATNVGHLPFYVNYDPSMVRVLGINEGGFLASDGSKTTFMNNISPNGKVIVGLSRLGRRPGIDGSGTVATLRIETLKPGTTDLRFLNASVKDPDSQDLVAQFIGGKILVK